MKSTMAKMAALSIATVLLASCSTTTQSGGGTDEVAEMGMTAKDMERTMREMVTYKDSDEYSDWKNENPTYIELKGNEALFDESNSLLSSTGNLTIKTSGVYVLSGEWDNGQVIVDAEDSGTVRIVLDGVAITSDDSAPLFIKNAENTIISLAEGTINSLTDAQKADVEVSEDEPDAALFSKDDVTINGTGTLRVNGNYKDGIKSKDDLKITGGIIEVDAEDDGIVGRDVLGIKDGVFKIIAGGDGIKSTNDEKENKGSIVLEGGTFDIVAGSDGMQAATSLFIADGSFKIAAGGGSPETLSTGERRDEAWGQSEEAEEETDTPSTKGMKAEKLLAVSGGTFTVDSLDDAIHTNDEVQILGGKFDIATGDDGIHADNSVVITGGDVTIAKSYEGVEGKNVVIVDGTINLTSTDDGINASDGSGESEFGMRNGAGMPPQMPSGTEGTRPEDQGEMPQGSEEGIAPNGMPENMERPDRENGIVPGKEGERPAQETEENTSTGEAAEGGTSDSETVGLSIHGGTITVNAGGDGLDSNGFIKMTGGTVIVNGPTNNGNGSLDYDEEFEVSGGMLITAGSSGMAMAPSEQSTQNSILMTYSSAQKAGTIVHVEDQDGNTVATFVPTVDYETVLISSEDIVEGETYTLYSGGTVTGTEGDGLISGDSYTKGTKIVDFTVADSVTWLDETGVTTAKSSGPFGGMNQGPGDNPGRQEGAGPGGMFDQLDEATREEVQSIMTQMREGTLSREEAEKKLEELGVTLPEGRGKSPR